MDTAAGLAVAGSKENGAGAGSLEGGAGGAAGAAGIDRRLFTSLADSALGGRVQDGSVRGLFFGVRSGLGLPELGKS